MPGSMSEIALKQLLAGGFTPAALLLPAPNGVAPYELAPPTENQHIMNFGAPPPAVRSLAAASGVPVFAFDSGGAQAPAFLSSLQPDVALVAGWPRKIGARLRNIPRYGFLNLHPSLLPDLRGPEPLFWAFRLGMAQTGVTIHQMDAGFDTGPILAQELLPLPAGISGFAAEQQAGAIGGALFARALNALQAGTIAPRPQGAGRYLSSPGANDFQVDPSWPAQQMFGFMRGVAEWQHPYPITVAGTHLLLSEAIGYEPNAMQAQALILDATIAAIQCQPGIVYARYRRQDSNERNR